MPDDYRYFEQNQNVEYNKLNIKGCYDIKATYRLHQLIKQYKPQFLLSHNGHSHSIVAHWMRFFRRWSPHKPTTIGISHGCLKRTQHFDALLCVSQYLANEAQQSGYRNPIWHMPNFLASLPANTVKSDHASLVFGLLSRLSPEKNIGLAIESLAIIKQRHPELDIKLAIAGDGECRDELEQQIIAHGLEKHVSLHGWIGDKDRFFANIDVLLLPSIRESFGLIILEAFACQTPVIASSIQGPAEIIKHDHNGLLFPSGNAEQLAENMLKCATDKQLRTKLALNGKHSLEEHYLSEHAKKSLNEILKSLSNH
ncbi:glycosyltransferase family 4 protein [Cardiobacteriaceae bacterium TAE3-ERU3]|nr:glycosyltransferase family 4 protein [Cardiobacteriaceae bacterium TAE3-ERU3]